MLNTKTKKFDITPDISLMPKLAKTGYSSPQAIAELIDNSIDARIDSKLLNINIKIDKNIISIADNGVGMNEKELVGALTLGYSKKENMLGEFGLGLKTACNSLGDSFEIITSPKGDNKQYGFKYSREEWLKGKREWQIEITSTDSEKDFHFTIVKINNLHRHWPQLAEILKKDLEKRFTPFIQKNLVNIEVNSKKCQPNHYELIKNSKKEFEITIKKNSQSSGDNVIYGWYGLLKEGSQKGLYGFQTYRRGRMITSYDKIGIGQHPAISRITGEIHLNFVPVTHNKREFEKESEEYLIAEKYLKEEFKGLIKEARRKANRDKLTKKDVDEIEIWQDKITEAVKSPELKFYASQIDSKTGMVKDVNGEEEEIQAEKREKKGKNIGNIAPKSTGTMRMPNKKNPNRKKIIKIKGKKFEFEHKFISLGINSSWKDYDFNKKKKKLVIYTNTDFPSYSATKDCVFYAVIHIAEAISEIMVEEAGEGINNGQEIKEIILRNASKLKMQID